MKRDLKLLGTHYLALLLNPMGVFWSTKRKLFKVQNILQYNVSLNT